MCNGRARPLQRCPNEITVLKRSVGKAIIYFAFTAALLTSDLLKAQPSSHSPAEPKSSAVDAKGVRHQMSEYGEGRAPWDTDRIMFVRPDYPSDLRARHIEGTGLFRITIDVKTGSVTKVAVLRSTGSSGLDASAARAIRQWRWRPQRWKEIDMPVTFTMRAGQAQGGSTNDLAGRATAYYRKGANDKAITTLDELIRQQPTSAAAYITRGSAYQLKGERDKALSDFNQAIRLDPKSARAYCDRAVLRDELFQERDKALADYGEAIRLAPNFQRAYFNRGTHFIGQHDYSSAIADFSRAIQLMPNDLSAYAYRAYAYAKQGDRTHAMADAMTAIKLKPTEFYLWQPTDLDLRAKAYRIMGQPELALRDLREAVRVIPNHSTPNDNLAWFLATCPQERFRNGTEAVSTSKKACELSHWKSFGCYDTLAVAHAEAGDFEQAIKYEKQALNDSSLAPKEKEEREKRLALFQQRKPFRDEF
jgi:TonB family protein